MNRKAAATAEIVVDHYTAREEALRPKKSHIVEAALKAIYNKHGELSVDLLLTKARDPKHPLHDSFEWNDEVAGEKFRRVQAMQMLLASKFVCVLAKQKDGDGMVQVDAVIVRQFLPESRGGPFRMRNEAFEKDDVRTQFAERMRAELKSWCNRCVDVPELAPLRARVKELVEE